MALKRILPVCFFLLLGLIFTGGKIPSLYACQRCDILTQLNEDTSDVTPPAIIRRDPPYYPYELQEQLIMGTVVLEVTILPDSTIGYIEVIESVPELDSLAIQAVSGWEFEPATREGEPVIGSLTVDIDFIPETFVEEPDPPDTLEIDVEELKEQIDRFALKQQEPLKHTLSLLKLPFYSENYHLVSWQRENPYIRRDKFSVIPSLTLPYHIFQNYYPFREYQISRYNWTFYPEEYLLPVTFVEAHGGLGFLNMDYGHITLATNDALNIDDLQFRGSILFQDGYWLGVWEKSNNFTVSTIYPIGRHTLHWNHLYINQEIPVIKFWEQHEYIAEEHYVERNTEHSFYWENPYLDAGLKYESVRFRETRKEVQPDRILYQLLLNRTLTWREHSLDLTWEYFEVEETAGFSSPFITEKHRDIKKIGYEYDGQRLNLWSEVYSGLDFQYHTHSHIRYYLTENISGKIGLLEGLPRGVPHHMVRTSTVRDFYTSWEIETADISIKSSLGHKDLLQYGFTYHYRGDFLPPEDERQVSEPQIELTTPYLKNNFRLKRNWGVTDWILLGTLEANLRSELDYFPRWHKKTNLEIRYNLEHRNAITAGLIYHHTAEFYTPLEKVEATDFLDGYIRISITPLFDFQADAKNLLQSEHLFGYPVAGIHWNVGMRWLFFN